MLALEGRAARIDRLLVGHRAGPVWPGVVLADGLLVGQVTVGGALPHLHRGSVGCWFAAVAQGVAAQGALRGSCSA
nr:hypothetical protein RKE32_25235 [Streptomyces sp. Li-HN-5-13]